MINKWWANAGSSVWTWDFLVQFSFFVLQTWPWDEQSRIRCESTMIALKVPWSEKRSGQTIVDRLYNTYPVDAQAFYSLAFELEGKFQQNKLQVEQWCEYLVRSSGAFKHQNDEGYLDRLRKFLKLFSRYRATKIAPFVNQIDILKNKVTFLHELWGNLEPSEKFQRIRDFIGDFTMKATCIGFLYWAKEVNEENATEMNILLFDISQRFMPYAPDVNILISKKLRDSSSDSNILSATVASFVDFFFNHLDDDFLLLRNPLILLFTSLAASTPLEKSATAAAAAEEHLLRSQIYGVFHEHANLLLSFGKMKRDLSKKKMLLRDFVTQVEMANAKIRRRFSDSFTSMEAEKMDYIYFVSISRELYLIEKHVKLLADLVSSQLLLYRMDHQFMRVFLLCLATWGDADDEEEIRARLCSMITSHQGIWQKQEAEKGLLAARFLAIRRGDAAIDWHPLLVFELEAKIQMSKIEIEAWCLNL